MLLASAAPLTGPLLGVRAQHLDQPVMWGAGWRRGGQKLYHGLTLPRISHAVAQEVGAQPACPAEIPVGSSLQLRPIIAPGGLLCLISPVARDYPDYCADFNRLPFLQP